MSVFNRRTFLHASVAAAGAGMLANTGNSREEPSPKVARRPRSQKERAGADGEKAAPMPLGLIVSLGNNPESAVASVRELGVPTCQVIVQSVAPEMAARLRRALRAGGIQATSAVFVGPGAEVYDFYQGPETIGFVPRETRAQRIAWAKQVSDFAKACGIPAVQGHCGFLPENPNDPLYHEAVEAIREVAGYCRKNGQSLRYETGQETPITLLRAIRDIGLDNQGVNFDCANFILYDKANPVDALEILAPYVQGIHAKDGRYPTDPKNLGEEVPIGQGKVDFPRIIQRLKELNYAGAITLEREVSGPRQMEDVRREKAYLERLLL